MAQLALCLVIQPIGGPGIDNTLPGMGLGGPVDPGYGVGGMPGIDNTLPGGRPPHVSNRPPGSGVTLPTHPIYRPDKPVPPGTSPGGGIWVIAYIPGQGFKWVAVTPGVPEKPVPGDPPSVPDQGLPPTAAPKPAA